jgi:hypothetical protein
VDTADTPVVRPSKYFFAVTVFNITSSSADLTVEVVPSSSTSYLFISFGMLSEAESFFSVVSFVLKSAVVSVVDSVASVVDSVL